ncbi:MAG: hypothetical protein R3Y29_03270 [bacterium]
MNKITLEEIEKIIKKYNKDFILFNKLDITGTILDQYVQHNQHNQHNKNNKNKLDDLKINTNTPSSLNKSWLIKIDINDLRRFNNQPVYNINYNYSNKK